MGSTPNLRFEVATLIKSLTRQTETLGTSLKPPRCPGTTTERGARYHVGSLVGPNASGGVLGLECCDLRVGQKYIQSVILVNTIAQLIATHCSKKWHSNVL